MPTHREPLSAPVLRLMVLCFFRGQDVTYQSLQSVVDWFREAVGIPLEKKYNSVLFGGLLDGYDFFKNFFSMNKKKG